MEASQLDDAADLRRLASMVAVISVRLLQLRYLAGLGTEVSATSGEGAGAGSDRSEDPRVLQAAVPRTWIVIVSMLAKVNAARLTPRQFWLTIARRGGWIGRKRDGRPGWKVIWRGWYDIHMMVQGAELQTTAQNDLPKCG